MNYHTSFSTEPGKLFLPICSCSALLNQLSACGSFLDFISTSYHDPQMKPKYGRFDGFENSVIKLPKMTEIIF